MNFDLNDEQREIQSTAKEFLADRFMPAKVRELAESRSYEDGLWKQISELGWPGIAIAEDDGGQGLGMVELAVLLEQCGYACAPSPLLGSAGAALVISEAGSDEQRAEWLPKLASGEATGSFGGITPDGASTLFCDLPTADVVVSFDGEGALVAPASDLEFEPIEAIDATRSYGLVSEPGANGSRGTSTPAATGSRWRSPPSSPGSPNAPWRWRSTMPASASSSAGRSAPTRR